MKGVGVGKAKQAGSKERERRGGEREFSCLGAVGRADDSNHIPTFDSVSIQIKVGMVLEFLLHAHHLNLHCGAKRK
jgi:hypothetical protein